MSELPEGWAQPLLTEVASITAGIGFPKHLQGKTTGDLPFYKVSDISRATLEHSGELKFAQNFVSHAVVRELRGHVVPAGSTVFAKIGEAIRLNRRALTTRDCLVDNNVFAITPNDLILSRYLYLFLRTQSLGDLSRSTTVPSLRKSDIGTISIPLPPLPEQRRIADALDALLARVDACRERLDRVPDLLKRFRRAVLAAATSGELTREWRGEDRNDEHASTWNETTLTQLCVTDRVITYGVIKLGDEVTDGIPCLRTSNVRWLRVDTEGMKRISPSLSLEYARTILRGGEVLVNVRGTLGGVAVATNDMSGWNVSREVAVVPVNTKLAISSYLAFWVGSEQAQRWLSRVERGVAYVGINIEDLRTLPVSLPPLPEQHEIVCRVEELFAMADRLEARYAAARAAVERLAPAALAKAFRGEL